LLRSIRVLEKGMEQLRLLQAVFHLARARRELNSLKQTRAELQTEVRRLIDELSPEYDQRSVRVRWRVRLCVR
jgi:cell division protein FtsB